MRAAKISWKMKIFVIALCICLVPLCLSHEVLSKDQIRSYLNNQASDQFVDDLSVIFQTFPNDHLVNELGEEIMELVGKKIKSDENSKITVQGVKDFLLRMKEEFSKNSAKQQRLDDSLNQFETTLSTKLQPERYNHLMKLTQVFTNFDSTSEEIENSLNYYYGTKPTETKP